MDFAVAFPGPIFQSLEPLLFGDSGKKILEHIEIVTGESGESPVHCASCRNVDEDSVVEKCLVIVGQIPSHQSIRVHIVILETLGLLEGLSAHHQKIGA